MLRQEAQWIGRFLRSVDDGVLFPLINVGSHTKHFREKEQPWIDGQVFEPLRSRGGAVIHTDLRADHGVDIVGDLTDPRFREDLRSLGAKSVLCCNLLEHVPDPATIASSLEELVSPGGTAVVTVPYRFPYHADPIDTMFRPTPSDLAGLFPGLDVVGASIVRCQTWLTYLAARAWASPRSVVRDVGARSRKAAVEEPPADAESLWSWSFRRFQVSCVGMSRSPRSL